MASVFSNVLGENALQSLLSGAGVQAPKRRTPHVADIQVPGISGAPQLDALAMGAPPDPMTLLSQVFSLKNMTAALEGQTAPTGTVQGSGTVAPSSYAAPAGGGDLVNVTRWSGLVSQKLAAQGINDPEAVKMLLAVIGNESSGNPTARAVGDSRYGDSVGLIQINAVHGIPDAQTTNPDFSIDWGAKAIAGPYQKGKALGLSGIDLLRYVYADPSSGTYLNPGATDLGRLYGWYRQL